MSGTMDRNASDVGLIVQGTLIFLSAVVAVIGYIVQSKLKSREHYHELEMQHKAKLKQLRLERIREKLDNFIGPMNTLAGLFNFQYLESLAPSQIARSLSIGNEKETRYTTQLDVLTNGAITKYFDQMEVNLLEGFSGKMNLLPGFVGPEVEEQIRRNPKSEIGKFYIRNCRLLILDTGKKLATLIVNKQGHLSEFVSEEEFKKKYPCVATSAYARNLFFYQFVGFIKEFEYIINNNWDKDDYTLLFPQSHSLPMLLHFSYTPSMITAIRKKEAELGIDDHKVSKDYHDDDEKRATLESKSKDSKNSTNKYIA